jgi:hypothetical protein
VDLIAESDADSSQFPLASSYCSLPAYTISEDIFAMSHGITRGISTGVATE